MFIIYSLIDFVIDFYNTNTFIMNHILDRVHVDMLLNLI